MHGSSRPPSVACPGCVRVCHPIIARREAQRTTGHALLSNAVVDPVPGKWACLSPAPHVPKIPSIYSCHFTLSAGPERESSLIRYLKPSPIASRDRAPSKRGRDCRALPQCGAGDNQSRRPVALSNDISDREKIRIVGRARGYDACRGDLFETESPSVRRCSGH